MSINDRFVKGRLFADPVSEVYSLKMATGQEVEIVGFGIKLIVRDSEHRVLGTIVKSTLTSGSVWGPDKCIGEYQVAEKGYEITPIEDGLLSFEKKVRLHPIDYLVERESAEAGS